VTCPGAPGHACGRPGRRPETSGITTWPVDGSARVRSSWQAPWDLGRPPPGLWTVARSRWFVAAAYVPPPTAQCPAPTLRSGILDMKYPDNGECARALGCGQWRRRCCAGLGIKRSSYQLSTTSTGRVVLSRGPVTTDGPEASLAGPATGADRMSSSARARATPAPHRCAGARQTTRAVVLAGGLEPQQITTHLWTSSTLGRSDPLCSALHNGSFPASVEGTVAHACGHPGRRPGTSGDHRPACGR